MIFDGKRDDIISRIQSRTVTLDEFNFDSMTAPPLHSLVPPQAIAELHRIATSGKLSANPKKRYNLIADIMKPLGFKKIGSGTNRVVYAHEYYSDYVVKIASDNQGMGDNPREFKNQFILKPFVAKVFEVSPCGTVALVERVNAFTNRAEFKEYGNAIFEIIFNWIEQGEKYAMEDIGTNNFMNWGVRRNFGPVLLDYPYLYEIDRNKLTCTAPAKNEDGEDTICGGTIKYEPGFNILYCDKCASIYRAKELEKVVEPSDMMMERGNSRRIKMKVRVTVNGVPITRAEDPIEKAEVTKIPTRSTSSRNKIYKKDDRTVIKVSIPGLKGTNTSVPELKVRVRKIPVNAPEVEEVIDEVVDAPIVEEVVETPVVEEVATTTYNRGQVVDTTAVASDYDTTPATCSLEVSSMDKETGLLFLKSDDETFYLNTEDLDEEVINYLTMMHEVNSDVIAELQKDMADKDNLIQQLSNTIENQEREISAMQEASETMEKDDKSIQDLADLLKQVADLQAKCKSLENRLSKRDNEITTLKKKNSDLAESISVKNEEAKYNKKLLDTKDSIIADMEKDATTDKKYIETLEKTKNTLTESNDALTKENESLKEKVSELEAAILAKDALQSVQEGKIEALESMIGGYTEEIDGLKAQLITNKEEHETETEVVSETSDSEVEYAGVVEASAKLVVLSEVAELKDIAEGCEFKKAIIVEVDDGVYITDQDANLLAITTIDGERTDNIDIKVPKKKG